MCAPDAKCIEQCLNGRPDAYRLLVKRYERPLMCYLTNRMGDPEAAAEVAQESFVRAYFRLSTLKKPDEFVSWLLGIAQRVMLESFRRNRREKTLSQVADPVDPATEEVPDGDSALAEAVAGLPGIYREVTILRYFGDLSCGELSQRLGVPLGTVTKRLSRAYGLLREALAPPGEKQSEVQR